ncbi:unknown [Clostridium sp. CAG:81]|nr:unknown [Clostridium sp. CAG:81]
MGNETKKLEVEIKVLKKRIEYLEQILDQAGIPYDVKQNSEPELLHEQFCCETN